MNAIYEVCLEIGYHNGEHFKSFDYFSFKKKTSKMLEIFNIDD